MLVLVLGRLFDCSDAIFSLLRYSTLSCKEILHIWGLNIVVSLLELLIFVSHWPMRIDSLGCRQWHVLILLFLTLILFFKLLGSRAVVAMDFCCQPLLVSNLCLYRLNLRLNKLPEVVRWHTCPPFLQDNFEDRVVQ